MTLAVRLNTPRSVFAIALLYGTDTDGDIGEQGKSIPALVVPPQVVVKVATGRD